MKKLKFKKKINIKNLKKIREYTFNNKTINLININYEQKFAFQKITKKSNNYINRSFLVAIKLIKQGFSNKLINGPISKELFYKIKN